MMLPRSQALLMLQQRGHNVRDELQLGAYVAYIAAAPRQEVIERAHSRRERREATHRSPA